MARRAPSIDSERPVSASRLRRLPNARPVLAAVLVIGLLGSCSHGGGSTQSPGSTHLVGLGDSVPAAAGCDCTSFVEVFGADVQRHTGRPNATDNLAQNGLDTEGLLHQLDESKVADAVSHADLLTVTIGANDFGPARDDYFAGTCGGPDGLDCFREALAQVRENLTAILTRIQALAAGHPLGVRVTNYWNVFEDGEVARDKYGDAFPTQSDRLTQETNAAICDVTERAGDVCIDVYTAFKQASPNGDPTQLLASDGDHPNQAGHDLIARTVAAAGYAPIG